MPLNPNPIPPPEEVTGQSSLPLTRVRRTIQADEDTMPCLPAASFMISICTELFIQYMAEQGHKVAQSESKPRRNLQYRDLATAVARVDNLQFLSDVVPKTLTYKEAKSRGAEATKPRSPKGKGRMAEDRLVKNRMRLSFGKATSRVVNATMEAAGLNPDSMMDDDETEDEDRPQAAARQLAHEDSLTGDGSNGVESKKIRTNGVTGNGGGHAEDRMDTTQHGEATQDTTMDT